MTLPVPAADAPAVGAVVSVQILTTQSLTPSIAAYGQVIADPTHTQSLTTQTGGQVSRVLVEAGQRVTQGQPLLVIQTDPKARLAFTQALSQQVVLQQDLTQKRYLFKRQMATHQDVASAEQAVFDATQRIKTLKTIGSDKSNQTILATEDALVLTVPAQVGSVVAPGGALLTLSARQALLLRFGIEPEDASLIEPGTVIHFQSVFAPQGLQTATVVRVDGQINPATRLLDVIAKPDTVNLSLITGTTLQGTIALPAKQGFVVPIDAVVLGSDSPQVFCIKSNPNHKLSVQSSPIAHAVPVRVLLRVGKSALIEPMTAGALQTNDAIVIQGQYVLQEGMAVRLVPMVPASGMPGS
jgi:RND family efflux transporter MFP subunit